MTLEHKKIKWGCFCSVWCCFGLRCAPENGSKVGPESVNDFVSKKGPKATWGAGTCVSVPFWGFCGCFSDVPESIKAEPFRDQDEVKRWTNMWFSLQAARPFGVVNIPIYIYPNIPYVFSPFCGQFWVVLTPCTKNLKLGDALHFSKGRISMRVRPDLDYRDSVPCWGDSSVAQIAASAFGSPQVHSSRLAPPLVLQDY